MTIEQEFFEAFGIPKMGCSRDDNPCTYKSEKWNKCKNEGMECQENEFNYPPITPEIVLGLEEIIIKNKKCCDLTIHFIKHGYGANGGYLYTFLGYLPTSKNDTQIKIIASGNTRKDALLKLCIQLKHELQSEVKELFNEK